MANMQICTTLHNIYSVFNSYHERNRLVGYGGNRLCRKLFFWNKEINEEKQKQWKKNIIKLKKTKKKKVGQTYRKKKLNQRKKEKICKIWSKGSKSP